jgi:hypothetical protein
MPAPGPFAPGRPVSGRGGKGWLLPEKLPSNLEELRQLYVPTVDMQDWELFTHTLVSRDPGWHNSSQGVYPELNLFVVRLLRTLTIGTAKATKEQNRGWLLTTQPLAVATAAMSVRNHIDDITQRVHLPRNMIPNVKIIWGVA